MPRKAIVLDYTGNDEDLGEMLGEVARKFPQAAIYIYFGGKNLKELNSIDRFKDAIGLALGEDQEYAILRSILLPKHAMEDLIFITIQDSKAEIKNVFPESLVLTPDDTVDTTFMKDYSSCMF